MIQLSTLPCSASSFGRTCRHVALLLLCCSVFHYAQASARKRPARPGARLSTHKPAPTPRTAARRSAARRTTTRKPARPHNRQAPDISAPRGTYAAESVQAILAETPSAPFLYPHALDPFFRALAQQQSADNPNAQSTVPALAATTRILQFGDSHTAADLFTGEVRSLLQSRFGNGGLGFQFPGHPFPGYHLAGSSRSQTSGWFTEGNRFTKLGDGELGLGGISISASRPGESVTLSTTCTTLQVQYLRAPEGGRLEFTDNGTFISYLDTALDRTPDSSSSSVDERGGTLTYACTPGLHDFQLTTLDSGRVKLVGLVTEQPGITYECLGINGAIAPLMLRWNQTLFAQYLRERDPSLIVLAYGTNEAAESPGSNEEYVASFDRLIETLHRVVPTAAVLVLGPYDRAMRTGRGRRARWQTFSGTERIIADQKQACRLHACAFYDQQARMGGAGAMVRWVSAGLAQPDRTHLTGTGYRALAGAFYRDLMNAYKAYQQSAERQGHAFTGSGAMPLQEPVS